MSSMEVATGNQQAQEQHQANNPSRQPSRSLSQTKPKGILKNAPHHAYNNNNNNTAQYVVFLSVFLYDYLMK